MEARLKKNSDHKSSYVVPHNIVLRRDQYPFLVTSTADFESLYGNRSVGEPIRKNDLDASFSHIFENSLIPILNNTNVRYDAFDFIVDDMDPLSFEDIFLQSFSAFPILHLINVPELNIRQFSFTLNPLERQLVTYFIDSIAPHCVCCEVKPNSPQNSYIAPELNPYLHLIVPLSFKYPVVMKTIVTASAAQLSLVGIRDYQGIAEQYLIDVIEEIPRLLDLKRDHDGWDDIFAVVVMLCFIEISVNCNNTWLALLNYAKRVLKQSSGIREKLLTPMGKFFIRYFISHEVMGETAWVHENSITRPVMIDDDPFIEELKKDYDTKIDLVFGCSPYLISLIHRISVIGQCLADLKLETNDQGLYKAEIFKHAQETEQMILCLNQQLPTNSELYFDEDERNNISAIAEIKRLASLIYLYGSVYMNNNHDMNPTIDTREYTMRIMEIQKELPDRYMSLLWPIFVVGAIAADEEDVRWFVLESLREMERQRKLKTVQAARQIIVDIWKRRDFGFSPVYWKDIIKDKSTTISLA
jgi:hypothetical protein